MQSQISPLNQLKLIALINNIDLLDLFLQDHNNGLQNSRHYYSDVLERP
jgi:hypothetical protein